MSALVRRRTGLTVDARIGRLAAVMDWSTPHLLAWRLSNTMDISFCVEALDDALAQRALEIRLFRTGALTAAGSVPGQTIEVGQATTLDLASLLHRLRRGPGELWGVLRGLESVRCGLRPSGGLQRLPEPLRILC